MEDIQVKQGLDLGSILRIVLHHKYLVLSVFLLFLGFVSYYSLSEPTIYRSQALLYFENISNMPMLDATGKGQAIKQFDLGYYEIILSTGLLNERFREDLKKEILKTREEDYAERAARSASTGQITLRPYMGSSQFIEISATSTDPFLVKKIVEVAMNLLKIRTAELDREGLQSSVNFIDEQMEITKSNLEKTEMSLQALKKKIDITKENEGPLSKIILMKEKLAELEIQIQIKQANIRALETQMDSLQKKMSGSLNRPVYESDDINQLKKKIQDLQDRKIALYQRYGAKASENEELKNIERQMTTLTDEYSQSLSTITTQEDRSVNTDLSGVWKDVFAKKNGEEIELMLLKGQARLYDGLIRSFEQKNPNLLEDAIEINRLERSKQFLAETLNSLIKQKESFSIQMYGTTGNLKIIDPPKNPTPIYKKVYTNIFIGAVLGLLIGIALAFGLEYLDNTIKAPEHITGITNIPIIGTIPHISIEAATGDANEGTGEKIQKKLRLKKQSLSDSEERNVARKKAMISQFNPRSFVSESYRTLRTNIQFANIDSPLRSILISSPGPSEGKTTTAINTAISFADMGHRVCLVDSDIRKPKYHQLFELNETPGLADVILQNREAESCIQLSNVKNLSILTAGTNAMDHSEIFSSLRMSFLMNELEKLYDIVIYDSPPILLLTDTLILSSRVDGMILVVKYGITEKAALETAITAMKNVRTNIIGIVFNDFTGERRGYYGYYKYAYHSYYAQDDTGKQSKTRRIEV